ncbi:hypothetical protein [Paraliomyxa miuraensis]|uniref:hypothetical protein n=1 Tax=Paraliomyxa miuraensis TaxID=376150 RepID=UPI0022576780|nr:hypothetical protein [Paraliomyxa miuraensis]MCX4241513.1 hypothetical protein [Paraliomyxa miuraensis]
MAASVLKSPLGIVGWAPVVGLGLLLASSGCDRDEAMQRQMEGMQKEPKEKVELPPEVPPHPLRDKLMPVLSKVYALNKPPGVADAEIMPEGDYKYELEAGVMAVIRVPAGLPQNEKVRAIVQATAEADAWAYRKDARREYADLVARVKNGYGKEQRDRILKAYAELRMLQYFNSDSAQADVASLPEDVRGPVEEMRAYYVDNKQKIWDDWMAVKMYARRVVAGDEPFRGVLRDIKKELGKEEPPPISWEDAMASAQFKAWATEIRKDEQLIGTLLNMRDMREREAFLEDTHSLWIMEGSPEIPDKAKKVKPEKDLGFGIMREDLGGGYNDLTYVFSKKLDGAALRKAYLRSIIYGHLLSDFGMLATAGGDFAERDADNVINTATAVVPDKYDPLYARCGSAAAIDTFINHFAEEYAVLQGLPSVKDPQAILNAAHECVIDGARGEIYIPAKDDDTDVEGPAPGSRLGLYQMLARFENMDADIAAMGQDKRTAEDDVIDEGEAILQKIKAKENEGKGTK